jgi:hypothetical protein
MGKIIGDIELLGNLTNNSKMITPEMMLEDAKKDILNGDIKPNKAIFIYLDTEEDGYDIGWYNANMSCSEILALIEVAKTLFLKEMGYLPI